MKEHKERYSKRALKEQIGREQESIEKTGREREHRKNREQESIEKTAGERIEITE